MEFLEEYVVVGNVGDSVRTTKAIRDRFIVSFPWKKYNMVYIP